MTSAELLTLTAKIRRQDGDHFAIKVLTAAGLPEAFAAETVYRMDNPLPPRNRFAELVARPLPEPPRAQCFVIGPKEPDATQLRQLESLRNLVITPAFDRLPYEMRWAADASDPAAIQSAKFIIVLPLAGDPEALYGLGFAKAYDKPVLAIVPEGTPMPVGAEPKRTLFYRWSDGQTPTISGGDDLVRALREAAVSACIQPINIPKPLRE